MLADTDHQDSWFFWSYPPSRSFARTLSHVQPYSVLINQVTKQTLLKRWLRDGLYEFPSSSSTHVFVSTSSEFITFKPYLEAHGIVHRFVSTYTPTKWLGEKGKSAILLKQAWPFRSKLPTFKVLVICLSNINLIITTNSPIDLCLCVSWLCLTHKGYICLDSIPAPSPLPQHTPLTSALINPPLLSTSSPPTVSFPIPTSSPDCTSTSDSLPPLLQVPFAPTPSPTPSSSPSPLNTHPMVTRAKYGIHKKRALCRQQVSLTLTSGL
ncbi:hypothetical protein AAG906_017745 [Vitis piasezkii]